MEKSNGNGYGDLNKVRDITKMGLKPGHVLIEVVEQEKSTLILPSGVKGNSDLWKVLVVGEQVKTVKVGDIVLELTGAVSMYQKGDKKYMVTDSYNISLYINPDNYEYGEVLSN
jgi:co-chaperonin GroES (HSP10)